MKNYFFLNKAELELKFLKLIEKDCSNKQHEHPFFSKDEPSFQTQLKHFNAQTVRLVSQRMLLPTNLSKDVPALSVTPPLEQHQF